jgi:hypothetical protein
MDKKKKIIHGFDEVLEQENSFVDGVVWGIFITLIGNLSIGFLMRWLDNKEPWDEFVFFFSLCFIIGLSIGMVYTVKYSMPKKRNKLISALYEKNKEK